MARKPRTEKEESVAVDHNAPPPDDFSLSETVEEVAPVAVVEEPVKAEPVKKEKPKVADTKVKYKWQIGHLDCAVEENGLKNVVKNVHWAFTGDDGLHTVSLYGVYNLEPVVDKKFYVDFDDLKEETLLGWIMASNAYDVEGMKAQIAKDLELMSNPPIVTKNVPWA